MIRHIIIFIFLSLSAIGTAYAQSPIEEVFTRYENVKGSRDFIASGKEMTLARSLIRRTPLALIAPEVDVLEVLKMQNASKSDIDDFVKELETAFAHYKYYGKAETKNGLVDVYYTLNDAKNIGELVIYNPAIYSLNILKGNISASALLSISNDT